MKKYILLLLSFISLTAYSQTVSNLPSGAKPYGNQLYIMPSTGDIWSGNAGYKYRVLAKKSYVDSLITLNYKKTQIDSLLALKASVTYVSNEITNTVNYINSGLALKQNTIPPNTYIENQRTTYQNGGFKLDSGSVITVGDTRGVNAGIYSSLSEIAAVYDKTNPVTQYNKHSPISAISRVGFTTPTTTFSSNAFTGVTFIPSQNTANWSSTSGHPQVTGVYAGVTPEAFSTGTILKAAAFAGDVSNSFNGQMNITEAIGLDVGHQHTATGSIGTAIGVRSNDTDAGTNGIGFFSVTGDNVLPPTGHWDVYGLTGYDSKIKGKWIAKSYITDFTNDSTLTDWSNFKAISPTGPGVITNMSHFQAIENLRGTNNTNFLIGSQPTGNWNTYTESARNNYLGTGNTLLNTTTDSGEKLQVNGAIKSTYHLSTIGNGTDAKLSNDKLTIGADLGLTGSILLNKAYSNNLTVREISVNSSSSHTNADVTAQFSGFNVSNLIAATNTKNWTNTTIGLVGILSSPSISAGSTGNLTMGQSVYASGSLSGMTVSNWYGYKSIAPTGSSVVTNFAHFNATTNATRGTNNTNILVGTHPTGNWNIHTTSTYNNYLGAGNTTIGGKLNVGVATDYADNAAALAGGLVVGDIYRTGDLLKIVH